jgi:multiple sugar transport system ATP-binding protein
MGSPAMNLIPAKLEKSAGALAVCMARGEREPLRVEVRKAPNGLSQFTGQEIIFGIRPEALTDADSADRNARQIYEGDCLIEVVEPAGSDTFAVTRLGGKEIIARLRADASVVAGQTAKLVFNLDKAVFFDKSTGGRIS